jgi:tape measure domain-containing protein
MAVSDIKIKYTIDTSDLNKAQQGFDNLTKEEQDALTALKKYNSELDETGKKAKSATDKAGGGIGSLASLAGKALPIMAAAFAVDKIMNFGKVIFDTTAKFQQMQKAIDFASGSVAKGAENFAFLKDLTARLGLDLMSAAEGYKTFAASSNLAGVSIEETNRQFEAVSKAVATLGLSSEDAKGVFLALGQIISKGTVASEELRGQIGERLPGAFNIAAKSMGVTTAELGKMLQKGQVASKDFLPKFATELEKTFGSKAAENVNTLTGAQNKFNSAIDGLILAVGTKLEPFLKGAYSLAGGIANQLAKAGQEAKVQSKENLGAIRAQNDINKEIFKFGAAVGVQQMEKARQQATLNALLSMELKIGNQVEAVTNARLAAAGKTGTTANVNLTKAERELEILKLEEIELTKLAGGYEVINKVKVPLTDKELKDLQKLLKEQYDARLAALEDARKIAQLDAEIKIKDDEERAYKMLQIEEVYLKGKKSLNAQYTNLGLKDIKQSNALMLKEIELNIKQQNEAYMGLQNLPSSNKEQFNKSIKDRKERLKLILSENNENYKLAKEDVDNRLKIANYEADSTNLKDREKKKIKIQNEIAANDELIAVNKDFQGKYNQVAIEEGDSLSAELLAKNKALNQQLIEQDKEAQKEKIEVILKGVDIAAQAYQGFTDLYKSNLDQELAASNARFDEETRLAGDNKQKLTEIEEKRAAKEKEIRIAKFKADQAAAVAQVLFKTAPYIAEYFASGFLAPLAAFALAEQAVQIAFILAQPVPEYAEGTKGKKHKGGKAIVGERGTERVVTESGKVYYTPPTATLLDLPAGSQVIPNNMLGKEELFMASSFANRGAKNGGSLISGQLTEIGSILKGLPIHQIQMDEQGFQKFIRTEKRTTKILNNRFPSKN